MNQLSFVKSILTVDKKTFLGYFLFIVESFVSFFLSMYVSYMFLIVLPPLFSWQRESMWEQWSSHQAYLLLCVLGWLLKQLHIHTQCRHEGFLFVWAGKLYLLWDLYISLSLHVYCDDTQECRGCFCWFLCRMFSGIRCIKWICCEVQ